MKVLIITGGDSSEREISLLSASNVKEALEENGHEVTLYDLLDGYEPITELSKHYDVLFPVLHGEEGEGGNLHEFLSRLDKPIAGTRNYKGLKEAWYKIPFKKWCDKNGIRTAPWKEIKDEKDILSFGFPCVLKASNGGSSKEVAILKSKDDLSKEDAQRILSLKTPLMVEKYLPGTEVTQTIINDQAFPLLEIVPPEGEFFSYENKYTPRTQEIPFAPSVPQGIQDEIKETATKIHKVFELGAYSRMDFIVHDGKPYILEVNTIPGLTSGSLIPKSAKASGMSFNQFIEALLQSAK